MRIDNKGYKGDAKTCYVITKYLNESDMSSEKKQFIIDEVEKLAICLQNTNRIIESIVNTVMINCIEINEEKDNTIEINY